MELNVQKDQVLNDNFNTSVNIVNNLKQMPSNEDLLQIYGLFKQANVGDVNTDRPLSFYAATKKSNEVMAYSYSNMHNIPSTALRFFTVYGPYGRPDMSLFKFTKSIFNKTQINLFNGGKHIRDFTYVDDIVSGIIQVVNKIPKKSVPFDIYNLASGKPKTLKFFLKTIEQKIGNKTNIKLRKLQDGDVYKTHASIRKAIKSFNYKPKFDIVKGIDSFVEWYKQYFSK